MKHQTLLQLITFFVVIFVLSQFRVLYDNRQAKNDFDLQVQSKIISFEHIHEHANIRIFIDGVSVQIPRAIGVGDTDGIPGSDTEGIQTYAADNLLHIVYAPPVTLDDIMLKNFFKSWGQEFTSSNFMGFPRDGKNLSMYVNGVETKLFQNYPIKDGDSIAIFYKSIVDDQ